ncbi:hypothetical protein GCM10027429_18740 [Marivirga atlantica]|jgi:hypothetical protein|uniref:Uncharacterized protein n=1 Tax=Marivirga atlantica TaxID=1548457 RepID=A0A937AAU4_9BACT|nr:hypothetical protein [Marivirga atlantica]MBL0765491.1 hypothetical protein [Marivirga atlantica]
MESNKLDTLFKNKLDRHSEQVSADAWAQLQAQLGNNKKNKKPLVWYAAASVALLFTLGIGYTSYQSGNTEKAVAVQPIELNNSLNMAQNTDNQLLIPATKTETVDNKTKQSAKVNTQPNTTTLKNMVPNKNEIMLATNNITFKKLEAKSTTLFAVIDDNFQPDFRKIESEIVVEMNYKPVEGDKFNEFKQKTNKLKSLASEISLADLRSAKNELFASALQFEKKRVN